MSKNILVIGGGGREHALAWKISQSPQLGELYVAPGNAGTSEIATNLDIKVMDFDGIVAAIEEYKIDLTLVAPDDPLAAGLVDFLSARGHRAFGPTQAAAQIEASKAFSKKLMQDYGIPTAKFEVFEDIKPASLYIDQEGAPIVVKVSGLALGKGVYVCETVEEAKAAVKEIFEDNKFGDSGSQVVIEEFLRGPEISIHAFCDGERAVLLPSAQDHKPALDGDKGPNTGGMGTLAPLPWFKNLHNGVADDNTATYTEIKTNIVDKILRALKENDAEFKGLLYPGLIMTESGPKVLEFNARFGDPETQSYMRLLETDLIDICEACIDGTLDQLDIKWKDATAVCLVTASGGYPGSYEKGKEITGLDTFKEQSLSEKLPDARLASPGGVYPKFAQANEDEHNAADGTLQTGSNIVIFHAGTKQDGDKIVTSGGRVLGITATADSLEHALQAAYKAASGVNFEGQYYRTDIGQKSLALEKSLVTI